MVDDFVAFERLCDIAHLLAYGSKLKGEAYLLGIRQTEYCSWSQKVRLWISKLAEVTCPSKLMPETADLQLQLRRAIRLFGYWSSAKEFSCDRGASGGLTVDDGYYVDGRPIFELAENVVAREAILRSTLKVCSCKGGWKTTRCGCGRKSPSSLCLLCNCDDSCENRGGRIEGNDANLVQKTITMIADGGGEGERAEQSDADEGQSDSDCDSDTVRCLK